MQINSENLAYWYFRLNGFLGHKNFLIHKRLRDPNHATEVDFLGVRFMHRRELNDDNYSEHMVDDMDSNLFKYFPQNKIFICLAEVKRGQPQINPSWIENYVSLERILLAVGCMSKKYIPKMIRRLRKYGYCNMHRYYISFIAIGSSEYKHNIPYDKIPIINWTEVLTFIYNRFKNHRTVKSDLSECIGMD